MGAAPQLGFDLAALSRLDFAAPDFARFPCLRLAYEAAESGPAACIALNAADEIAVAAFLKGAIPFLGIPRTIERVLAETPPHAPASIQDVLSADQTARVCARSIIGPVSYTHLYWMETERVQVAWVVAWVMALAPWMPWLG